MWEALVLLMALSKLCIASACCCVLGMAKFIHARRKTTDVKYALSWNFKVMVLILVNHRLIKLRLNESRNRPGSADLTLNTQRLRHVERMETKIICQQISEGKQMRACDRLTVCLLSDEIFARLRLVRAVVFARADVSRTPPLLVGSAGERLIKNDSALYQRV